MHSRNFHISRKRHVNFSFRLLPESPLFLIPSPYWLPSHDVNLELEGVSFGICFLRHNLQVNLRAPSLRRRSPPVDLVRANALAAKIRDAFEQSPDALAIVRAFENHRFLREIAARGADETHYGLMLVREISKEETIRAQSAPRQTAMATPDSTADINLDNLLKGD